MSCALLVDRYRTVAYTQRWFGDVRWPADGPRFGTATHGRDLVAFCEALGAGPVAVVAWSYGCHAALLAALARPELFTALLIHEPGMPTWVDDEAALAAFGRDIEDMFPPVFAAAAAGKLTDAARLLIDGSGGPGAFDRLGAEHQAIALENAHTMAPLLDQEPAPPVSAEELAGCRVPVTVAWGGRTRPIFAIPARAAAGIIGGTSHREVPGAGHLWPIEDPAGFADLVAAWRDGA